MQDITTLPGTKELMEVNPYGLAVYGTLVALLVTAVIYLAKQLQASHKRETDMSAKFIEIMKEVSSDKNKSDAARLEDRIVDCHTDLKQHISSVKVDIIGNIQNNK